MINTFVSDTTITMQNLSHDAFLWTCDPSSQIFNFFDLIKGFVPLELFDFVMLYSKDIRLTLQIISVFMDFIYSRSRKLI